MRRGCIGFFEKKGRDESRPHNPKSTIDKYLLCEFREAAFAPLRVLRSVADDRDLDLAWITYVFETPQILIV